jgi:hypothetical protein
MDGGAGTATAVAISPACLWCDTAFEPRKAGSPQRFCTSKRREEFHSAGRLGWLDPDTMQDAGAVGDAMAELTNAAIALRLRPNM